MHVEKAKNIESLLDDLQHGDRAVVRKAVDALVALSPREPLLAGLLERRLDDERTRWRWPVAYTLGRVVEPSEACLEVLADGLGSQDQDVRWATQRLMTELGGTHSKTCEMLLALLGTGSPTQRRMAVYCLRDIGLSDDRIAAGVVRACNDPEPLVRVAAVTSVASRHALAAGATSILRQLADEDSDLRVRNVARFALGKVRANTDPAP